MSDKTRKCPYCEKEVLEIYFILCERCAIEVCVNCSEGDFCQECNL